MYGNTLAPLLSDAVGIPVSTRATQGPDQNILLLESGKVQLAFLTTGSALQARNGTAAWAHGKKLRSMRALFPMYDTPFQFVALDSSGITTPLDLANKRSASAPKAAPGDQTPTRSSRSSASRRWCNMAPGARRSRLFCRQGVLCASRSINGSHLCCAGKPGCECRSQHLYPLSPGRGTLLLRDWGRTARCRCRAAMSNKQ